MAAAMDTPMAVPNAAHIARVEVIDDCGAAETVWRSFEASDHLSTPYQRFDFQSAWQTHIGAQDGLKPFIVVAYDAASQPLVLLPLVIGRENGMRVASYLGGKHVTFNMPLWRRDFAAQATKADMDALVRGIQQHTDRIDVLALARQPQNWLGIANPLALLPHQPSTNDCPVLKMVPGAAPTERISNSFR
jgi:CelD/BcsL family acetyltransferase involved in cellulose biosynthesis